MLFRKSSITDNSIGNQLNRYRFRKISQSTCFFFLYVDVQLLRLIEPVQLVECAELIYKKKNGLTSRLVFVSSFLFCYVLFYFILFFCRLTASRSHSGPIGEVVQLVSCPVKQRFPRLKLALLASILHTEIISWLSSNRNWRYQSNISRGLLRDANLIKFTSF